MQYDKICLYEANNKPINELRCASRGSLCIRSLAYTFSLSLSLSLWSGQQTS